MTALHLARNKSWRRL